MNISERFSADDEKMKRRYQIGNKLVNDWFAQCIPTLALEFGIPEETVKEDLESDEFEDSLVSGLRLHVHRPANLTGNSLTEQFVSNIRQAAVSSDDSIGALNLTLQAIIDYIAAMRESVLVNLRFHYESMLLSRDRAVLERKCDMCGAPMQIVPSGGGSYFAGCSRYPECYNAQQLTVEDLESAPRVIDRNGDDLEGMIQNLVAEELSWKPNTYDEPTTKAHFIEPILRALGWDTFSNTDVLREAKTHAGRADYGLVKDDGTLFGVVEAKRLYIYLISHHDQIQDYMRAAGVRFGILTNGFEWRIFEAVSFNEIEVVLVIEDILQEPGKDSLAKMVELIGKR